MHDCQGSARVSSASHTGRVEHVNGRGWKYPMKRKEKRKNFMKKKKKITVWVQVSALSFFHLSALTHHWQSPISLGLIRAFVAFLFFLYFFFPFPTVAPTASKASPTVIMAPTARRNEIGQNSSAKWQSWQMAPFLERCEPGGKLHVGSGSWNELSAGCKSRLNLNECVNAWIVNDVLS